MTAELQTMAELIAKYPAAARLIMAALEDGLILGPMQVADDICRGSASPASSAVPPDEHEPQHHEHHDHHYQPDQKHGLVAGPEVTARRPEQGIGGEQHLSPGDAIPDDTQPIRARDSCGL